MHTASLHTQTHTDTHTHTLRRSYLQQAVNEIDASGESEGGHEVVVVIDVGGVGGDIGTSVGRHARAAGAGQCRRQWLGDHHRERRQRRRLR
jgi:hypothetical protein